MSKSQFTLTEHAIKRFQERYNEKFGFLLSDDAARKKILNFLANAKETDVPKTMIDLSFWAEKAKQRKDSVYYIAYEWRFVIKKEGKKKVVVTVHEE